jgi:hypothetical protein
MQARIERDDNIQAAIALLRSWREADGADAEEQRETGDYLMRALDEDRWSDRPHLPPA